METKISNQLNETERPVKWGGLFNEFFWICSGANRKILRQCPTEYSKYFGIGGTIFFTAAMAMLSGGYAFFTIFDSTSLAVCFGVFWGLLIFNLDRFIVNTMYSDGKHTISKDEFKAGLPRLIIALFLGIVISTPLELKIYEDEIKVVIEEAKAERLKQYQEADNAKILTIQERIDSLTEVRTKILSTSPDQYVAGDYYTNEIEKSAEKLSEIEKNIHENEREKLNLQSKRRTLLLKRTTADSIAARSIRTDSYDREIKRLTDEKRRYDENYSSLLTKQYEAKDYASTKRDEDANRLLDEIKGLEKEREGLKERINNDGFRNILEAEYGGFQAHMSAFHSMKFVTRPASSKLAFLFPMKPTSTWIASFFITLLFIIIEVTPTLFKMMLASGPYDELLGEEMARKKAASILNVSTINDEANTQIKISTEKNKDRIEAEIAANKMLLKKIAETQAELLETAIEEWRKEELEKIKANPSQYIKQETTLAKKTV